MKMLAWALLAVPLASPTVSLAETQLALLLKTPSPRVGDIPDGAELKRRGARIGRIDIQVDDVFETASGLAAPYRVANGLHISTKQHTVAQQLLFHSGEPYDARLVEETARLLRSQRYFNEASVEIERYNEDNTVDLLVRVHDVWTLSPGLSFGRKGGENKTSMEFSDTNFLGWGKQVSLERTSDVDRTAWRLEYVDPNVFGSWWRLSSAYSSMSDGAERAFALSRPFYSLDSRWSANFGGSDITNAVPRYSLGKLVERIDMQEQRFDLGGGVSHGLQNGWTRHYLAGVSYQSRAFSRRATDPTALLPDDRVLAYPWVGMEVIEDQYVTTRNLDQIGRTEDLQLGRSARLDLGLASSAFGSTRDALILRGSAQAGAAFGESRYLINSLSLDGRLEHGHLVDGLFQLQSRYYWRHSANWVFFASATGTQSSNLDPEDQLLLGGDNGLRGYPLRYQAGTASALLTLEERLYTHWQPLKLVNVGAAVFMDAGRTWGHDAFAAPPSGWLPDVGLGLRLGSARSGLGNVLHIDLAFPLAHGDDIDSMQLLIETRKSF